jgi:hypothetical protein
MWHDGLKCFIERLEVNFVEGYATLWLRARNCADMQGAIDLVSGLDARVTRIYTFSGGDRDTCYTQKAGKWAATTRGKT